MNSQDVVRRRQALSLIAPILFLAAVTGGVVVSSQHLASNFVVMAYAGCAVLIAIGYVLIKYVDRAVFPVSLFLVFATSFVIAWRIYDASFGSYREEIGATSVLVGMHSFIPIIYLFAFVLLSRGIALIYSLTVWLILFAMVCLANIESFGEPIWPEGLDFVLLVVGAFQPIFIALIYFVPPYAAAVAQAQVETEAAREALEDMEKLTRTDSLTGLHNRRFLAGFWQEFAEPNHYKPHYLSLFVIDVDYFKQFNDKAGHVEGDRCLKKIAAEIQKFATDFAGHAVRYGGEEFLVIIPSEVKFDVISLADQIRFSVLDLQIEHPAADRKYVTVSVGASSGESQQSTSESQWMRAADAALYEAKSAGRNRSWCRDLIAS